MGNIFIDLGSKSPFISKTRWAPVRIAYRKS